jgi:hypothetical protein
VYVCVLISRFLFLKTISFLVYTQGDIYLDKVFEMIDLLYGLPMSLYLNVGIPLDDFPRIPLIQPHRLLKP